MFLPSTPKLHKHVQGFTEEQQLWLSPTKKVVKKPKKVRGKRFKVDEEFKTSVLTGIEVFKDGTFLLYEKLMTDLQITLDKALELLSKNTTVRSPEVV